MRSTKYSVDKYLSWEEICLIKIKHCDWSEWESGKSLAHNIAKLLWFTVIILWLTQLCISIKNLLKEVSIKNPTNIKQTIHWRVALMRPILITFSSVSKLPFSNSFSHAKTEFHLQCSGRKSFADGGREREVTCRYFPSFFFSLGFFRFYFDMKNV